MNNRPCGTSYKETAPRKTTRKEAHILKILPSQTLLGKTLLSAALLSLSLLPAFADAPSLTTAPTTAPASAPVSAPGTAAAALDALVGKPQIVGVTEKNGTKFLGRVLSGDHTHYTFQAFHFAGPTQTTPRTSGFGRNRRTARLQTPTYIPDVQAIEYLLAGAAGSQTHPREMPTGAGILAASDIKFLQALSPPAKPAKKSKAAAPKLSTAASSKPSSASPWAWTMTTLWPSAANKAKSKS